jgi:hypothetical protein
MYGPWKCLVETPFGEESYDIILNNDTALFKHHTGDVFADIVSYTGDSFFLQKKLDTPIYCRLLVSGYLKDENIEGSITIDDYLQLNFRGTR